ncbi:type I secretion C-terminal target domain (VC_A0849 subclass) [Azospirillum oryzae]|uniref:Type I secretion C-terminal target domain (VC_A0849 subclass) n=1 Tax=Azospirillum oryzae TaxID=286727 RepID=A0A1X7FN36_9PROT|nr:Calx-beta domain-containing protein [Azospirillum oryzae]SMF55513.1 type I secretion C-terminal target domain (VC_A0849 subclass) [Azospirillum oryzae]
MANVLGGSGADTLTGTADRDYIAGGAGNDLIDVGIGNDYAVGGTGSDTFVFRANEGWDVIADFSAGAGGDVLDLRAITSFTSFQSFLAASTQQGADTVVTLSPTSAVKLAGVQRSALTQANILLNGSSTGGTGGESGGGTVSISPPTVTLAEGNGGGSTAYQFTVTRSGDLSASSTVTWAVAGSGTAAADAADFAGNALPQGTLSFAAGQATATISLPVLADALQESDEGFTVTLSNPSSGWTVATSSAIGVITNDDSASGGTGGTPGGMSGQLFTGTDARDAIIGTANNDTIDARGGNDYMSGGAGSDTFVFRSNEGWDYISGFAVGAGGDVLDLRAIASFTSFQSFLAATTQEGADTVVTLSSTSAVKLAGVQRSALTQANVLLTGSSTGGGTGGETGGTVSISPPTVSLAEGTGGGSTPYQFTVTRSGDLSAASSVTWAVVGSGTTAADAADFVGTVLPQGTLTFAAGQATAIISVPVLADSLEEADESFSVTLTSPSAGWSIATASATGVIPNDDTVRPPTGGTVSISPPTVSLAEGNGGGSTAYQFTVTRSGDLSASSTVTWAVAGSGTAAADAADFAGNALPQGTLSFAAGQATATISLPVLADALQESDEGFTVTLSNPSSGWTVATSSAIGVITNDDSASGGTGGTPGGTPGQLFTGTDARDAIVGTAGNDTIDAGGGNDYMSGGAGSDTFVFRSNEGWDYINGFAAGAGGDVLDLRAIASFTSFQSFLAATTQEGADTVVTLGPTSAVKLAGVQRSALTQANVLLTGASTGGGTGGDTGGDPATRTYTGTPGADIIWAAAGTNIISGLDGDDILGGNTASDTIVGGAGNDTLYAGDDTAADTLLGGSGDDVYWVNGPEDVITEAAGEGVDEVVAKVSWTLGANLENLTLQEVGAVSNGFATGNDLANIIEGNAGNNEIHGNGGNDQLDGGAGADQIYGEAGDDTLIGGMDAAADTLYGGAGNDTYYVSGPNDVVVENANEGTDTIIVSGGWNADTIMNIERVVLNEAEAAQNSSLSGGMLPMELIGNSGNNLISGGWGNETIRGGAGNDTLSGGRGADTIYGDAGDDTITLSNDGACLAYGGEGADVFRAAWGGNHLGGAFSATIGDFVLGQDTLSIPWMFTGIEEVNGNAVLGFVENPNVPMTGTARLTLSGVTAEAVTAWVRQNGNDWAAFTGNTSGGRVIYGTDGGETLTGGAGNDVLDGKGGADVLYGGDGNDTLTAGADSAADTLYGGTGDDTYIVGTGDQVIEEPDDAGGTDTVIVSGSWTNPYGVEHVILSEDTASQNGSITGNYAKETLIGNAGDNVIDGSQGDDVIDGKGGNDTLYGGMGYGGSGVDTISGGDGDDDIHLSRGLATGGSGADAFTIYTSGQQMGSFAVTITDFELGVDRLNVLHSLKRVDDRDGSAVLTFGYGIGAELVGASTLTLAGVPLTAVAQWVRNHGNDWAAFTGDTSGGRVVFGTSADETLTGGAGNDLLDGAEGADLLEGGAGNDTLFAGIDSAADTLSGGAGSDIYYVRDGDLVVEDATMGTDTDTVVVSGSWGNPYGVEQVILSEDSASLNGSITGNQSSESFTGNSGNNRLDGGWGDDTLYGMGGDDTLIGGWGDDSLDGGFGNDLLSASNGTMNGGAGQDTMSAVFEGMHIAQSFNLLVQDFTLGEDTLRAPAHLIAIDEVNGSTVLQYADGPSVDHMPSHGTITLQGVGLAQVAGWVQANGNDWKAFGGDTLGSGRYGTLGADMVQGDAGDDFIVGLGGSDTLAGGDGNDTLQADDASEVLFGEAGNDALYGGDGNDTLSGGSGNDTMWGGGGADIFDITGGTDSVDYIYDFRASDGDRIYTGGVPLTINDNGTNACIIETGYRGMVYSTVHVMGISASEVSNHLMYTGL